MPQRLGIWKDAAVAANVASFDIEQPKDNRVTVEICMALDANESTFESQYAVFSDSRILVEIELSANKELPQLPRIGMQMAVVSAWIRCSGMDAGRGKITGTARPALPSGFTARGYPNSNMNI